MVCYSDPGLSLANMSRYTCLIEECQERCSRDEEGQ